MKINSRIEIEFAGITLPVVYDAEGREVVPVKPISDVFGLSWADMKKKIGAIKPTCGGDIPPAGIENQPDSSPTASYLSRRLGACIGLIPYAGQLREMVCIRLDRVSAFLNQIEPERVRGGGNETGADFLEAKQCEWDDLLHEYETRQGGMLSAVTTETKVKAINVRLYLSVLREKRATEDKQDRRVLGEIANSLAREAGASFQPDLSDAV